MDEVTDRRPWALLVTRNFPPLLGGMEKLNEHVLAELAGEWRVALAGPAGCAAHAPGAEAIAETNLKPLPVFLLGTAWRALRSARRHRPRLVIAGSGLAAPMAWLAARASGAKFAVYLHGLDVIAPSIIYQHLWLPFIRAADLVLVNSGNTAGLAQGRGVRAERVRVLHPGTNLPDLDAGAGAVFRRKHDLGAAPVLLSVGRLTRRKGLAEFVARALPAIIAQRPDARLVVIGAEAGDALHGHGGGERERILAAARENGVEMSLVFLGSCDEATLSAAYQAARVHVFPVLDLPGDVEGFGMVALESAAHGLPTVAFAVGGVPDAVAPPTTGMLVASGDYDRFAAAVINELAADRDFGRTAACRAFAADKAWPAFGARLRALARECTGD